jgi:hypothetical protein
MAPRPEAEVEHRRRPGLRRYSFTYDDGGEYGFLAETEADALSLARRTNVFQDLHNGKIISFEWAKYVR